MKPGDTVKHKLTGEVYRILRVNETLAVVQCPPYTEKIRREWQEWDRYICQLENLELHPEGKVIFDWLDQYDNKYLAILSRQTLKPGTQLSLI